MVNYEESRHISEKRVREVIDTLLTTTTHLDAQNPLLRLTLVEEFLTNPDLPPINNAREYAIQCIIIDQITEYFHQKCDVLGIIFPRDAIEAKSAPVMHQLNAINSGELFGWAMLYLCYVRADWSISLSDFYELSNIIDRTARRYRDLAISRLTRMLIENEWEARVRQRKHRIHSQLPNILNTPLVGRQDVVTTMMSVTQDRFNSTVLISGIAGIGKSAITEQYVRQVLDLNAFEFEVIWITSPKTTQQIQEIVMDRLSPHNRLANIHDILYLMPTIVVLDAFDSLQDIGSVDSLLRELANAQVIITSRRKITILGINLCIFVRGLTEDASRQLLRNCLNDSDYLHIFETRVFDKLYKQAEGNPLGLLVGASHFSLGLFTEIPRKSLDHIFADMFTMFTLSQKLAWIALAFCPIQSIPRHEFFELFGALFEHDDVHELVKYHIATLTDDLQHVTLTTSAKYFVFEVVVNLYPPLINDILNDYFYSVEMNPLQTFPLSVYVLRQIVDVKLIDISVTSVARVLATLLDAIETNENRELSRLWFEIIELMRSAVDDNHRLCLFHARLLIRYGEWQDARRILQVVIKETGSLGDFEIQSRALLQMSKLHKLEGDYGKAVAILNRIDRFQNLQKIVSPEHLLQKSVIAIERQRADEAREILATINDNFRADILKCEVEILCGNFETALSYVNKCFENAGNNQYQLSHLHVLLGRICEERGHVDEAIEHYCIGLDYFRTSHEIFNLARVWTNLGVVYVKREELGIAAQYFIKALRVQSALGDRFGFALTKHNYDLLPESFHLME